MQQILIDHGANLETEDPSGNTPLQYATYGGNLTMVEVSPPISSQWRFEVYFLLDFQLLLEKGADPDSQNAEGYSAIHRAALDDRYKIVKVRLQAKPCLSTKLYRVSVRF